MAIMLGLIGLLALGIGALVFFGLYQFFGDEYGALIIATPISAKLCILAIASEIGVRRDKTAKEVTHVR